MKYLCQYDYGDIPYPTDMAHKNELFNNATIKQTGCGICSICMLIDRLTLTEFTITECRDLSMEVGANLQPGTNMDILAPAVGKKFQLAYQPSNDIAELMQCLHHGGCAVVHISGDYDDYIGVFSHGGHYVVAISATDTEICVLDPSWKKNKYEEKGRKGKVRQDGFYTYVSPDTIQQEVARQKTHYYLFSRQ